MDALLTALAFVLYLGAACCVILAGAGFVQAVKAERRWAKRQAVWRDTTNENQGRRHND